MEKNSKIYNLNNQDRFLIDYSNLKTGIISHQKKFANMKDISLFEKKIELGFPLVLPLTIKAFHHNNDKAFLISENNFMKKIFMIKNKNYKPLKKFFLYGNKISSKYNLKKKYTKLVDRISTENMSLKKFIKQLKKNKKIVGAFQTRNIPHLGHEKIIKKLIQHCDYVIINPVIGPKKKGDIKPEALTKIYSFYIKKFFDSKKVFFKPLIANMFYSGPREAVHHALLRQKLGFDMFIVGRDHAGAENVYKPNSAPKILKKLKKKFKISIITHQGSYYCLKCKKIVLKEDCKKDCKFLNISGTEFRKKIILKKPFKFARPELNKYLKNFKGKIFYND